LPALVDRSQLPRVFGLDSLSYNVAGIVGPALGAVIASTFSPAAATLSLAASAMTGGVVLATLPLHARVARPVGPAAPLAAIVTVFRQRVLALVTAATSVGQVGAGSLPVVAAVVAVRDHHGAAAGYLMAAYAIGGLAGSIAWIVWPADARNAPLVVMIALIASGLPLVVAAGIHQLPSTAVFFAISGAFLGPMLGALFTTRQDQAPPHLRAQVFATGAGLKTTAGAAGAALAGLLAHLATSSQLLAAATWPLVAGCLGLVGLLVPLHLARRRSNQKEQPASASAAAK
jgi:hypothetical protein